MDGTGRGIDRLTIAQAVERAENRRMIGPRRHGEAAKRAKRLLQILQAAEAAGRFRHTVPHPLDDPFGALRDQREPPDLAELSRMTRSEARRVGKEWVRTCRVRGSPYQ